MGEFAFDEDSRVEPGANGEYAAELTSRWNGTRGAVNGGYLLATCTRALALSMPFPDPIVISGFFLRPGMAGAATIRTSLVRGGRTTAFGEAVLTQQGTEIIRATAAFAHIGGSVIEMNSPPETDRITCAATSAVGSASSLRSGTESAAVRFSTRT